MSNNLMYIELKMGYSDDDPAWIGYVKTSKSRIKKLRQPLGFADRAVIFVFYCRLITVKAIGFLIQISRTLCQIYLLVLSAASKQACSCIGRDNRYFRNF